MAGTIEIRDKDVNGVVTVELRDLLPFFEAEGQKLIWSIIDLEAIGDLSSIGKTMLGLEQEVKQSPHGLFLEWSELKALAEKFEQIMDLTLVGCQSQEYICPLIPKGDLRGSCEIVIEAIDSSLWSVYARDEEVIQRLTAAFQEVKTL